MDTEHIAIIITIAVQLIFFAFGYGKLVQLQNHWKDALERLQKCFSNLPCQKNVDYFIKVGRMEEELKASREKLNSLEVHMETLQNQMSLMQGQLAVVQHTTSSLFGEIENSSLNKRLGSQHEDSSHRKPN